MSRFPSGSILASVMLMFLSTSTWADEPSLTEIAKTGKAATAMIEKSGVVRQALGSSFCIHTAGFFLTNAHVVNEDTNFSLLLHPGLKNQRRVSARVVRVDKNLDLALLRANEGSGYAPLPLGTDDGLTELLQVIAFGFPFGTALANKNEYPAISVNVGSISSCA